MTKPNRCPLCGAHLTAEELLDNCAEFADTHLGVLAGQCPHCQGRLEVRPIAGAVEIGYIFGTTQPRFDVALTLPCEGLAIQLDQDAGTLRLAAAGREWSFAED